MTCDIIITKTIIDLSTIKHVFNNNVGAMIFFIGVIKGFNNNKHVKNISYCVFENLFYSIFKKKCMSLLNESIFNIKIIQFSGTLNIGQINSVIIVYSNNRNDAFNVCKELVDFLKTDIPIWKKERYLDGSFTWINA